MRKKRRSKRKLIWIILAILSITTVAIVIGCSEADNKNVAESKAEKTKISISRQESTKEAESDKKEIEEKVSDNDTSNSSLNNNKQSRTVYVGKTGNKYHYQNCRTLKNGAYPMSLDDALAEGRTACKVCH